MTIIQHTKYQRIMKATETYLRANINLKKKKSDGNKQNLQRKLFRYNG
jgi:hypothetical protein